MLLLPCSAPLFTSMPPFLLLLMLSLFSAFLSSPSLSATLSTCRVHAIHATHTHMHAHTYSKYGCVLPSTDARRLTVREITVNICSMNMMRLAERRRGEEDNLLCHLSLYGCLSYITPSLSLYLPAHLSLTHSLPPPLFFCLTVFPSHFLFIHFQSFPCSAQPPTPHSPILFFFHTHLTSQSFLLSCLFNQDAKPHLSHLRL